MQTIPQVFIKTAEDNKNKVAVFYKNQGVYFQINYKDILEKVKIINNYFINFGIKKEDKIAILSENRPEWLASDIAIMTAGAITVPLHTTLNPGVILNILNHSEARILIVSNQELLNKVFLNLDKIKYLEKIIFLDKFFKNRENSSIDILNIEDIYKNYNPNNFKLITQNATDICSIVYTSGTTGEPKGVLLSHENILSNVKLVTSQIPVRKDDIFLSFLPLSHTLERTAGQFIPILSGASVAYAESSKTLAKNLKEIKPTILICVPRIFEKFYDAIWDKINNSGKVKKSIFTWALKQQRESFLYKIADILVFKKIRDNLGGNLRLTISGGAGLNPKLAKFFYKIGVLVLEGYGLTETSPVISVNTQENFSFGSVGKVLPGVKVKIDKNTKEILVQGPNVFCGYYKNELQTKECFSSENYFKTGDLGFINDAGFLTIIGRKKEMLVTNGGKNIWPEPIENMLNDDRFISQSMIVGNNRNFVTALIVPDWQEVELYIKKNNLSFQSHELLAKNQDIVKIFQDRVEQKINTQISDFEKIRKFILLSNEFSQEAEELTPTLKLRRHIIESHYKKEIEQMYN